MYRKNGSDPCQIVLFACPVNSRVVTLCLLCKV